MREFYQDWKPNRASQYLLDHINLILEEYERQGYKLTLRQLYYQLVSRDLIKNSVEEYAKIGNIVNRGRLAGLIDWDMIEDRVRVPSIRSHWNDPREILRAAASSYYRYRWDEQPNYVEVWCEKDAVSNIIQPVCRRWDVTFMANRGYSSQSAMYDASKRLNTYAHKDRVVVVYLGDHDPSGIDMTRDIRDRLNLFLGFGDVDRLALNMDQVIQYQPPENPAKTTDSRFRSYVEVHGASSWELDALEPNVLATLVEDKIKSFIDFSAWVQVEDIENEHKERLMALAEEWEDV